MKFLIHLIFANTYEIMIKERYTKVTSHGLALGKLWNLFSVLHRPTPGKNILLCLEKRFGLVHAASALIGSQKFFLLLSDTTALGLPVSYTHLDVYKRQVMVSYFNITYASPAVEKIRTVPLVFLPIFTLLRCASVS